MTETQEYRLRIPEKLAVLRKPATTEPGGGRFLVIKGGRGSAKSMSIAQDFLIDGFEHKKKFLCAREIQNSIKDSVHALLKECIEMLGLGWFYKVQADGIFGQNGTEFIFKGLRANAAEIKSMQGVDRCWIEEADKTSAASWKYLVPTIRQEYSDGTCSQIVISFNPELEEDYTYQNFVVDPPKSATVVEMNWRDNPWFPAVLEAERLELWEKAQHSKRKMEEYNWTWEGQCKSVVEGAVYSEEMAVATAQGRICEVPYTPGIPVDTYWDLGRSDETAIWFIQRVHGMRHAINFYENTGHHIDHYLGVLQDLSAEHGYIYGTHALPHDSDHKLLGQHASVLAQVRAGGRRTAALIPRPPRKSLGINAGRTVFGVTRFDKEKCADGLAHARRYRYGVSEHSGSTVRTLDPVHDEHSNAMDAWQTFGLADKPPREAGKMPSPLPTHRVNTVRSGTSWMGR